MRRGIIAAIALSALAGGPGISYVFQYAVPDPRPDPRSIAIVIADIEGWKAPRSLVRRLHNPCAMIFAEQLGAEPGDLGYASYKNDPAGWRSCENDLSMKMDSGMDLSMIIEAWSTSPAVYRRAFEADPRGRRLLESARR